MDLAIRQEFTMTAKQSEAIDLLGSDALFTLLYGGARSTKTFTILYAIALRALAAAGSRHAVLRYRFNHVKASVIHDTFPKMMGMCFPDEDYHIDKSDWFARLGNGSEIWFGGLDDKERTEKVLGNEYASIFLNECSQISYSSYVILITRLAQMCHWLDEDGIKRDLDLKMYFDENPPATGHWTHKLFIEKKDPDSKRLLSGPEDYAHLLMNPGDNVENLPAVYLKQLEKLPKRQRDRFLLGKFGDENENALWTNAILEASRVNGDSLPTMARVVVAVDPSGADGDESKNNDDIGIGVVGLGTDGIAYCLEDLTLNASPKDWGLVVASAYDRHGADRVVAEVNYGGAMVENTIRTAKANISYKAVTASRGKVVRAEPVSALHETGKIKLVGNFDDLEDELLAFTTTGYTGPRSPNRADWFVWAITELMPGLQQPQTDYNEPVYRPPVDRTWRRPKGWGRDPNY